MGSGMKSTDQMNEYEYAQYLKILLNVMLRNKRKKSAQKKENKT